jgi:hypothetical protein
MTYNTDIERLNYYEGEFLGAVDFQAEQEYHRDMRRRHNLGQHTWGIVTGLELAQVPNTLMDGTATDVDVFLQPGMAVDGFGREIVVLNQVQLTAEMFAAFYNPSSSATPTLMYVWIGYQQSLLQPPADACTSMNVSNAFGRIEETYMLSVTATSTPQPNGAVVVGGNDVTLSSSSSTTITDPPSIPIPNDESVPFQEFSTDDSNLIWWVALGRVKWDPYNQVFVQISTDPVQAATSAGFGRVYAGDVAAWLYAPAAIYKIVDRNSPYPLPATTPVPILDGVAVEIAGSLQVDYLFNAETIALIGAAYDSTNPAPLSPLTIEASSASTNQDLIQFRDPTGNETWYINQNLDGTTPGLNIGEMNQTASPPTPMDGVLFLQNGGNVGVGTTDPQQNLSVNAAINLDQADKNTGTLNPGLSFGSNSGEGIASNQKAGGANANGLDFYTSSQIQMSITSAGNVGIGTTAPEQNLSIYVGLNIDQGDANTGVLPTTGASPALTFGRTSGEGIGSIRSGANKYTLNFYTGYQMQMSIANPLQGGVVSTTGSLVIGAAAVVGQVPPSAGSLTINGNRTYMLGTDTTDFHWIMAGGLAEFSGVVGTPGNNAIGLFYNPLVNEGAILINENWMLVANGFVWIDGNLWIAGSKGGFVVDRFININGEKLERGDVVVIHKNATGALHGGTNRIPLIEVERAKTTQDPRVCGVVDEPTASSSALRDLDQSQISKLSVGLMVTLGAYAQCKVDADIAPIAAGDLLTTSATEGHAQKLDSAAGVPVGAVIGKALASLAKGKGLIPVLVAHQ